MLKIFLRLCLTFGIFSLSLSYNKYPEIIKKQGTAHLVSGKRTSLYFQSLWRNTTNTAQINFNKSIEKLRIEY